MKLVVGIIGAAALCVLAEMVRQIIQREYSVWAPSLAQRLVLLAGTLSPRRYREIRRREWLVVLRAYQEDGGSGILWGFTTLRYLPGLYASSIRTLSFYPIIVALSLYPIILAATGFIAYGVISGSWSSWQPRVGPWAVLFWVIACAASNLLPAPVTTDVEVTMSSPVNIAIAFLFPPPVAAAIVGFGSLTDWELRRETTPIRSAFNRSQLALAAAGASVFLHPPHPAAWRMVVGILCFNLLNLLFVTVSQHFVHGTALTEMFRRIITPVPSFIGSYLILGALGLIFALVYRQLGWWAVAPFVVPLLFARYALRHSKQLEQAQRERGALAVELVYERERARIASDMHDLVLQRLAAAQIQSDNITSALKAGKVEQASALASMVKEQVAGVIADLRRSALDDAVVSGSGFAGRDGTT